MKGLISQLFRAVALAAFAASVPAIAAGPGGRTVPGGGADTHFQARDRAAAPDAKEPRWLFGRPRENTPAAQLSRAKRLEKGRHWGSARSAYDALVHNWGASAEAPEAQLSVARIYERDREFEDAFREYQYYLERYSSAGGVGTCPYGLVVSSQRGIAFEMLSLLERGGFWAPSTELVASMFRHVVANAPDDPDAPRCVLSEGRAYETGRKWPEAVRAYEKLASKYPASPLVTDAWYRSANCRWILSEKRPNDRRELENALEVLRLAVRTAPDHREARLASERIAALVARQTRMAWQHAEFYDRVRRKPEAALAAYREFLVRFPTAAEAPLVRERVAQLEREVRVSDLSAGGSGREAAE